MLYPLKFIPIYRSKIWGGDKLRTIFGKDFSPLTNCGESWELSGVPGNTSVVSYGPLKNNSLEELIEIYMDELVGYKIFEKFATEFPLLIKFIDANDILSIQVHPDDELSKLRHKAFGKTEMWYILNADENAEIITGFNQKIDKNTYLQHLRNKTLKDILNIEKAHADDVLFIPAGRIHSIGSGIFLAEIQQTSDITYRIYDWERKDEEGNERELHTELAVDAIDFSFHVEYKTKYQSKLNASSEIVNCKYFTTNILIFDRQVERDYYFIDSFVIYICIKGSFKIFYDNNKFEIVKAGETVLIPAILKNLSLIPEETTKLLEIFIK